MGVARTIEVTYCPKFQSSSTLYVLGEPATLAGSPIFFHLFYHHQQSQVIPRCSWHDGAGSCACVCAQCMEKCACVHNAWRRKKKRKMPYESGSVALRRSSGRGLSPQSVRVALAIFIHRKQRRENKLFVDSLHQHISVCSTDFFLADTIRKPVLCVTLPSTLTQLSFWSRHHKRA